MDTTVDSSERISLTETIEFLKILLPRAGSILRKYFESGNYTQKSKGGVDFVTQADEEVDAFLLEQIKKRFPLVDFLTEETAPSDYSGLKNSNNLWVIDPLDGTINFSRKQPHFAISVGLVEKGIPKLGVVYMPMTEDMYWATRDQQNAFHNGKIIHVSPTSDLGESVIACDWAWGLEKRLNVVKWLGNISTRVRQVKSMGSAVADLASLAEGSIDGYIHSGLKPWDVAASALFIEKAGGKITTPNGHTWDVFKPDILATNKHLHQQILELIK